MKPAAGQQLESVLGKFLSARLGDARHLCVALSGGMDSVVLLHALQQLLADGKGMPRFSALHVHHGISSHADEWAAFCSDFCDALGIPLQVVRVDVPRDSGEGPEAAARRMRYAVFADCPADGLLLAHHRDDQAETVLLNLLRGAGVAGAAGMPAVRKPRHGPMLIRPLLDVPRTTLEQYAVEQGLSWIDDESNSDRHFRRNFLRHDILPALDAKFPAARQSLARAAGRFGEAAQLLDELAELDMTALCAPSGRIRLMAFNDLSPARARNVLRRAWGIAGFRAPEERWIEEARKQLASTNLHSETCVATSEAELHVYRGELYFVAVSAPIPDAPVRWNKESALPWAGGCVRFEAGVGAGISREWISELAVELRSRQGGECLKLQVNRPRRRVRNLLQEAATPPWERARLPLLWIGDQLAWVGGLGVDASFACPPGEAGLMPVWEPVPEAR